MGTPFDIELRGEHGPSERGHLKTVGREIPRLPLVVTCTAFQVLAERADHWIMWLNSCRISGLGANMVGTEERSSWGAGAIRAYLTKRG